MESLFSALNTDIESKKQKLISNALFKNNNNKNLTTREKTKEKIIQKTKLHTCKHYVCSVIILS